MKIKSFLLLAAVISFLVTSCQNSGPGKKVTLKTDLDSTSYAIGVLIGHQNMQSLEAFPGGDKIKTDILSAAFYQVLKGDSALISPEAANEVISRFFQKMNEKDSQENLEAANGFLEKNKKSEGVITTPSGLQYEILTQGNGPLPTEKDMVMVHYHGTMQDGEIFDSSIERGEPVEFPVLGVIPGWAEALQLMPVGSKWKIYIPPSLAYGEHGINGVIKPNSLLIFEVELLEILAPSQEGN